MPFRSSFNQVGKLSSSVIHSLRIWFCVERARTEILTSGGRHHKVPAQTRFVFGVTLESSSSFCRFRINSEPSVCCKGIHNDNRAYN